MLPACPSRRYVETQNKHRKEHKHLYIQVFRIWNHPIFRFDIPQCVQLVAASEEPSVRFQDMVQPSYRYNFVLGN
jgi:hypothetical protein